MRVDDRFRAAGRARAVEPERGILRVGGKRLAADADASSDADAAGTLAASVVVDCGREASATVRVHGQEHRRPPRELGLAAQRFCHFIDGDHHARAALVHERRVRVRMEKRIDDDGYAAVPHRPEKRDDELRTIGQRDEHPLLFFYAERRERRRGLANTAAQLATRDVQPARRRAHADRDRGVIARAKDLRRRVHDDAMRGRTRSVKSMNVSWLSGAQSR